MVVVVVVVDSTGEGCGESHQECYSRLKLQARNNQQGYEGGMLKGASWKFPKDSISPCLSGSSQISRNSQ